MTDVPDLGMKTGGLAFDKTTPTGAQPRQVCLRADNISQAQACDASGSSLPANYRRKPLIEIGLVAVPLMVMIMLMAMRREVMGRFVLPRALWTVGWLCTATMAIAIGLMFATW